MNKDRDFVGFSTIGVSDSRSWALYDMELIKQDLYNHFHTRIGERVMRPTFGCRIWDLIGEQMTPSVRSIAYAEVKRIVENDSRLEAREIIVSGDQHAINILVDLYYRPFDAIERFKLVFDARQ